MRMGQWEYDSLEELAPRQLRLQNIRSEITTSVPGAQSYAKKTMYVFVPAACNVHCTRMACFAKRLH
jgi:hypothetical protein